MFCGRVTSQKSAATALSSFIETLHAYRKELSDQGLSLNLKGAAWLAAFPEPNRAVHLRRGNQEAFTSATEELECAADMEPFNYDFLGKAIDTGFRVASKATPEKFLLSVQAARLILNNRGRLGFAHDIRFEKPEELKGVNHGEPYPKLFIDTMDHLPAKEVRRRERQLLNGNANNTDHQSLLDYLNDYCSLVGTDDIALPLDDNCEKPEPPESYLNHKEKILAHFEGEKARAASQETGATHEETSEQEETLDNPDTLNP